MRVVIATSALQRGGAWRHMCDLASALPTLGVEVLVAVRRSAVVLREDAARRGLEVISLLDASRVRTEICHVHLHDTYCQRCALLIAQCSLRPVPVFLTEHLPRTNASDPLLLPGPRSPGAFTAKTVLKRLEFGRAHRVIVVSRGSAAFLARRYGVASKKLAVIPNGIAVERPPPALPDAGDAMRVLAAGSLITQKGFDVLISALAARRRPWQVTIAGDGGARGRLQQQADRLAPGQVDFAGEVADIAPLLARSDIVCVPSRWEAASYVALEAMAAGRGVVASCVDGLADIVVDGVTGRLVAPDQPRMLASALDAAAADSALRDSWGRGGYQRVRRFYSAERMAIGALATYQHALGER